MLRTILSTLLFLVIGAIIGCGLLLLSALSLRFDHPLLEIFGIRKPQVIGFLPYWLLDKADKDYRPYITTLTYFGLALDRDGKPIYLATEKEEEPGWTALKGDRWEKQAKKLNGEKLSLLIHSADDETIEALLEQPIDHAHALMGEVGPIMRKRGFTDLNLDIESFLEASPGAQRSFTVFVKTVSEDIKKQKLGTLTVEIPPIALFKSNLADPEALGKLADAVVLMTYDYHYSGSFLTGPVAPIGGTPKDREFDVQTAITAALQVIPKEKIILGVPLYGYQWETIGAAPGSATIPGSSSTASTKRVETLLAGCATCSAQMDTVAKEPYVIYKEDSYFEQIYSENTDSMKEKIRLADTYKLGGIALWALGYEDGTLLSPLQSYKPSYRWVTP